MKKLNSIPLILLVILSVAFSPVQHGWADYGEENAIECAGTIQEVTYANPHALIKINQEKRVWTVSLAPVSRMQARGVTGEMVHRGAVIKVLGYPHKQTKD